MDRSRSVPGDCAQSPPIGRRYAFRVRTSRMQFWRSCSSESVHAAPEQIIGRAIGSTHVVLARVEIHAEDSLEMAARTASPFAALATHDVHSVPVAQVHDQLRHSPVDLAVRHASAPLLRSACCGWISAPDPSCSSGSSRGRWTTGCSRRRTGTIEQAVRRVLERMPENVLPAERLLAALTSELELGWA